MSRNIITYIISSIIVVAASSCMQDDTIRYNDMTIGQMEAGAFITDYGIVYNIVENSYSGRTDEDGRAIILCDILRKTKGAEDSFDIRLKDMVEVSTVMPVWSGDESGQEQVEDPVHIDAAWVSGGHLNCLIYIHIKDDKEDTNLISLIAGERAEDGSYEFTLRHNSFSDVNSANPEGHTFTGRYISFPVSHIISEDTADITLKWKWFRNEGSKLSNETETFKMLVKYHKPRS